MKKEQGEGGVCDAEVPPEARQGHTLRDHGDHRNCPEAPPVLTLRRLRFTPATTRAQAGVFTGQMTKPDTKAGRQTGAGSCPARRRVQTSGQVQRWQLQANGSWTPPSEAESENKLSILVWLRVLLFCLRQVSARMLG